MFDFDVKIVRFDNPSETWYQLLIVKYFYGIPYNKKYHNNGYGDFYKSVKYDSYADASDDRNNLRNKLRKKYYTKTRKTVLD